MSQRSTIIYFVVAISLLVVIAIPVVYKTQFDISLSTLGADLLKNNTDREGDKTIREKENSKSSFEDSDESTPPLRPDGEENINPPTTTVAKTLLPSNKDKETFSVEYINNPPTTTVAKTLLPSNKDIETFSVEYINIPPTTTVAKTALPSNKDIETFSVEYFKEHLVYATAISDNHFKEALGMFGSVRKCIPSAKFIVYDLGLNMANRQYLTNRYPVELRLFPYQKYSHIPHVRNLYTYAWKPIIVQELAQEYEVILYLDSSMRMKKACDIKSTLAQLLKFPFFDLSPYMTPFIEYVHNGMVKYLHYPKHRKDVAHVKINFRAGCWIMWINDAIREKLIKPWVDCALHRECIAPKGARLKPCHYSKVHDGRYKGCHRYDQSALNVIIFREFGIRGGSKAINLTVSYSTWAVRHRH